MGNGDRGGDKAVDSRVVREKEVVEVVVVQALQVAALGASCRTMEAKCRIVWARPGRSQAGR